MIEMIETAHILHHATRRSLVLLDEIGRGTATADGLAIARSVVEYLHNHPRLGSKTMFATHYHELTDCADYLPRARNYHRKARAQRQVHTCTERAGQAEKVSGLCAQLAGLPKPVLRRARELQNEYESGASNAPAQSVEATGVAAGSSLHTLFETLVALDINELSPVEALTKLYDLQRQAKQFSGS